MTQRTLFEDKRRGINDLQETHFPALGWQPIQAAKFSLDSLWVFSHCCFVQDSNEGFRKTGLIIHFMATTTKAKRCIFISRTPKCLGASEAGGAGRRYRLFSALLRSPFGPIRIPSPGCLKQQCCSTLEEWSLVGKCRGRNRSRRVG